MPYFFSWRLRLRNLYPKGKKQAKRVENPSAAARKSLPKQRELAKKVEIPAAPVRKSLPKQREIAPPAQPLWHRQLTPLPAPEISAKPLPHIFSIVSSHILLQASLGMRRSPLGEMATEPTLGPSGRQERLNCWLKKRR